MTNSPSSSGDQPAPLPDGRNANPRTAVLVLGATVVVASAAALAFAVTVRPWEPPKPLLPEAQLAWCARNDMTPNEAAGELALSDSDAVLQAADELGIPMPELVARAREGFKTYNRTGDSSALPDGWPDAMKRWSQTEDYARACSAAWLAREQ